MKKVLITGITGQDGSLMAEYLLCKYEDIEVYGSHRRLSVPNHCNIQHLKSNPRFKVIEMDITDPESISNTFS